MLPKAIWPFVSQLGRGNPERLLPEAEDKGWSGGNAVGLPDKDPEDETDPTERRGATAGPHGTEGTLPTLSVTGSLQDGDTGANTICETAGYQERVEYNSPFHLETFAGHDSNV